MLSWEEGSNLNVVFTKGSKWMLLTPPFRWTSCWRLGAGGASAQHRIHGEVFVVLLLAVETWQSLQLSARELLRPESKNLLKNSSILIEGCLNWCLMLSVCSSVLCLSQKRQQSVDLQSLIQCGVILSFQGECELMEIDLIFKKSHS